MECQAPVLDYFGLPPHPDNSRHKGIPDGTWKFMAFEQKGRLKQIMFQKSTLLVFFFLYIYICIIYYVLIIFMTYNICTPKDIYIYKNMTYICVFCGFIS